MITCSKTYTDIPFAHRQHRHEGHCRLIHGHNWSFEFTFGATKLDANGFVIDFGSLKWIKDMLAPFDHALVLNNDDPLLGYIRDTLIGCAENDFTRLAQIVVVDNCGAEGLAKHFFDEVGKVLLEFTQGRVRMVSVVVYEDGKNSAKYSIDGSCTC